MLIRRRFYKKKKIKRPYICRVRTGGDYGYRFNVPFSGKSNITVDWGDGVKQSFSGNISFPEHEYTTQGYFTVTVEGDAENMTSRQYVNRRPLIQVIQWGDLELKNITNALYNSVNLSSIPDGPLGYSYITDVGSMFEGCSSLSYIPPDLFKYNAEIINFTGTFSDCYGITSIPVDLFKNCTKAKYFYATFDYLRYMTSIPGDLFRYNTEAVSFQETFRYCDRLTAIPPDFFKYNTKVTNFYGVFMRCAAITSIPANFFNYNKLVTDFDGAFELCSSLGGTTPRDLNGTELWERAGKAGYPGNVSGSYCFMNCYGLTNYSSIPNNWK